MHNSEANLALDFDYTPLPSFSLHMKNYFPTPQGPSVRLSVCLFICSSICLSVSFDLVASCGLNLALLLSLSSSSSLHLSLSLSISSLHSFLPLLPSPSTPFPYSPPLLPSLTQLQVCYMSMSTLPLTWLPLTQTDLVTPTV